MSSRSTSPVLDRIMKAGLATPALALTIVAGAALAQQQATGSRMYEVIIESVDEKDKDKSKDKQKDESKSKDKAKSKNKDKNKEKADKAKGQNWQGNAGGIARVATLSRAQDSENARVVVEINREVGGQTVAVRRVNEEPIVAKIDGKVVSKDHYTMQGSILVVTHPESGEISRIRMPQMVGFAPGASAPAHPGWIGQAQDLRTIEAIAPLPAVGQALNEPREMLRTEESRDSKESI